MPTWQRNNVRLPHLAFLLFVQSFVRQQRDAFNCCSQMPKPAGSCFLLREPDLRSASCQVLHLRSFGPGRRKAEATAIMSPHSCMLRRPVFSTPLQTLTATWLEATMHLLCWWFLVMLCSCAMRRPVRCCDNNTKAAVGADFRPGRFLLKLVCNPHSLQVVQATAFQEWDGSVLVSHPLASQAAWLRQFAFVAFLASTLLCRFHKRYYKIIHRPANFGAAAFNARSMLEVSFISIQASLVKGINALPSWRRLSGFRLWSMS